MSDQGKPTGGSSLKQRIDQDTTEALKSKDSLKLSVLRMLKSEIKYKEIEKGSELSDDEVISVLSSSVKKRKDSIQQFEKGGRDDLASKEKAELELSLKYLPEQLTEEELSRIISQAIEETSAAGVSDLGKVMKVIMPKVKGRADGKRVNQMVSSQLSFDPADSRSQTLK
ncbi:MAG: GatB/YqeY domain-containing protein [candidate division Zixibacteria bacterium]|nr:GatB/YqeY domain-containing protein [candidate division Zixibacteria bacterium]